MMVSNLYGALARGGAERVCAAEVEALAAAGHQVVVVSGSPPPTPSSQGEEGDGSKKKSPSLPLGKEGVGGGFQFYPPNIAFYTDLSKHNVLFRLLWHAFDIWNTKSARIFSEILTREKPDVVHTHNLMGLGFGIPSVIHRANIRHVHTVHDVQLLDPSGLIRADRTFVPSLHQRAYIAVMRKRIGSPNVVIFPSEFLRELHAYHGFFPKSRQVVLRNPAAPPSTPRTTIGSPVRFLFVGQLEPHKGIVQLLNAWEKKDFFAPLDIIGGGTLEKYVKRRAEKLSGVRVLGRLERAEVDAAYERIDWIVVPSTVIENAPAVLMEALGRGIPAVASATGGIPELVRDNENGFLSRPGDIETLVAALSKAAVCATYSTMSARAVASVARYDIASHVGALLSIFSRT